MNGTGFVWILLACAIYGAIHSILASITLKEWTARKVGRSAYQRFYRLFFVLAAFITTLPLLALVPLLPDRKLYTIPAPWVYLTLFVQILAVIGIIAGVMQTGMMDFLGIRQLLEPHHSQSSAASEGKLVTGGLYHWVRHPLYTATFLVLWLAPIMTWNLLALNIGLSAYLLIGIVFEERKLVRQFNQEYIEYRKKTPRIFPGMRLRR